MCGFILLFSLDLFLVLKLVKNKFCNKTCLDFHLIYISFVFLLAIVRYFGAKTHYRMHMRNDQITIARTIQIVHYFSHSCTQGKKNQACQKKYSHFSVQIAIHQKLKKVQEIGCKARHKSKVHQNKGCFGQNHVTNKWALKGPKPPVSLPLTLYTK